MASRASARRKRQAEPECLGPQAGIRQRLGSAGVAAEAVQTVVEVQCQVGARVTGLPNNCKLVYGASTNGSLLLQPLGNHTMVLLFR